MAGIGDNFKGLPMSELIGAPLAAACDAQKNLAKAQYEFIKDIAFSDDEGTKTRVVEFDLQRPTETPDGVTVIDTHVQAPFLGLVPIPSLLVEDVNIEFQMEVSATESTTSKTSAEASTKAEGSYGLWFAKVKVEVQGKVSSSRENTRSTNQTAKYQVRVVARQQQPTEGLSRLMDVMAQCVAPIPSSQASQK
ncbi:MAG: DUF2589 domain-containing protein [Treponema sp.]|nr:DUF2589 domain-containing protein [Treponema sp.]